MISNIRVYNTKWLFFYFCKL